MGYDLHVTRADPWYDAETNPITLVEWAAYVAADPEMRMDGFAEATVQGSVLRVESEGLAVWTAYSGHGRDGNMAWFDYRDGRIVVKNPDAEIISKMKKIAAYFQAKVLGDEGESY
jgi:hypothetical protein